ncbi:MAG: hypothetical protein NC548_33080, partial [Lachnospiraceae bacterium]|nr:hypothetical protein [Lachnospiraceae bacterium]
KNGGAICHFSYVIPKNIKYAFLNKGEHSIGPCNTSEKFRGQGLYPYMLSYIVNKNPKNNYYVFIREDNVASIHGAVKAGFIKCTKSIVDTKFLKIFKLEKENINE